MAAVSIKGSNSCFIKFW